MAPLGSAGGYREPTRAEDSDTVYSQLQVFIPVSWDNTQGFGTKCSGVPGAEQKPHHGLSLSSWWGFGVSRQFNRKLS